MAAKPISNFTVDWRGEPQFSYANPDLLFGVAKGSVNLEEYDFSRNKVVTVHKPADCVKLNPADFGSDVSVSSNDSRFMVVIGPQQNVNYLVYIYDRARRAAAGITPRRGRSAGSGVRKERSATQTSALVFTMPASRRAAIMLSLPERSVGR